jgi:hypothetical protein
MKRSIRETRARVKPGHARRLIHTLVAACDRPAHVLELHYWSREPGMLDIIRAIATMREETRGAFEAFVALVRDTKSIEARLDPHGALTLASPQATQIAALARYVAENDFDIEDKRRFN